MRDHQGQDWRGGDETSSEKDGREGRMTESPTETREGKIEITREEGEGRRMGEREDGREGGWEGGWGIHQTRGEDERRSSPGKGKGRGRTGEITREGGEKGVNMEEFEIARDRFHVQTSKTEEQKSMRQCTKTRVHTPRV